MRNVAIIGCGVIGLTTATAIQDEYKSAVRVTIFADKFSPNTTSDIAAGLWGPYIMQDTESEKLDHDYFLHLWKSGYASEAGISLHLVKKLSRECEDSLDYPNIVYGGHRIPEKQLQELSGRHKKEYKSGCTFVSFICEPKIFLPFLQKRFLANGGMIIGVQIDDFAELSDFDLIVNCTGLGSKAITKDALMTPIRGQVARVHAPWLFHTIQDDENYVVTNHTSIVLGGTEQMGDTDMNPRKSDTDTILKCAYNFVPALKNAPLLFQTVGLRPGRNQVRLEREIRNINGKNMHIIHNYGHGGGGVTLSYGCALEVLELIKEVFPNKSKL
ncbi:hypothetical protein FQA39_LY16591 [Lamprigera yunnana]|nr:hypothetical protein FQA39_LY16591 [Lamprigera yunnana]